MKPTIGEIPTDGIVPLSETLDHVGPMCLSVEDAALLYGVLRGIPNPEAPAPRDVQRPALRRSARRTSSTCSIGRSPPDSTRPASDSRSAGAVLDDVDDPAHEGDRGDLRAHRAARGRGLSRRRRSKAGPRTTHENVRLRLEMGRYILAEDYVRAQRGRQILTQEVREALGGRDGLLLPSMPVPATRLGAATVSIGGTEETVRNITLRLTQLFNITGHPAISLPCGKTDEGLPVGLQIVGDQEPHARNCCKSPRPSRRSSQTGSLRVSAVLSRVGTPSGIGVARTAWCGRSTGVSTGWHPTDITSHVPEERVAAWVDEVMQDTPAFFDLPPTSDYAFTTPRRLSCGSREKPARCVFRAQS